jgi:TrpR family trp operon transcriptional repressor
VTESEREAMIGELAKAFARLGDTGTAMDFMRAILTPRELEKIALRWRLVKLLREGHSQRRIAEELGVSLCKITRGSRELKHGSPGFHKVVEDAFGRP